MKYFNTYLQNVIQKIEILHHSSHSIVEGTYLNRKSQLDIELKRIRKKIEIKLNYKISTFTFTSCEYLKEKVIELMNKLL